MYTLGVSYRAAGWGLDTHVYRKYKCMHNVYIQMLMLYTNICIYNMYTCISYTIHTDICTYWVILLQLDEIVGQNSLDDVVIATFVKLISLGQIQHSTTSKDYFATEDQLSECDVRSVGIVNVKCFVKTKMTLLTTADLIWECDINFNINIVGFYKLWLVLDVYKYTQVYS